MSIELTILVADQSSKEELGAGDGFSVLVKGPGRTVLFDTGPDGPLLQNNAKQLGVDLSSLSTVVISHGHRDHTGGLADVAQSASGLHLYSHPLVFSRRWQEPPGKPLVDLSCPCRLERLVDLGVVFHAVKAPELVEPWLLLSGPIGGPRTHQDDFVIRRNDDIIPDWFQDELCMLLKTRRGWLIVTGCCHRGLKNTLRCARFLTRDEPIFALLGGLHLHTSDAEKLREAVQILGEFGNPGLYPSHCTGSESIEYLTKRLGDQVHPLKVGTKLEF